MKTILVLVDFSERSKNAAKYAYDAAIHYEANVLLYNSYYIPNTVGTDGGAFPQYAMDFTDFETQSLSKLKNLSQELSVTFDHSTQTKAPEIEYLNDFGRIGDNIKGVLQKREIWFVVMGEKSNVLLDDLLAGSDSSNILRKATCPVLLIPDKVKFSPFTLITLASASIDEHEIAAMNFVTELIAGTDAEIRIVHVTKKEESTYTDSTRRISTEIFSKNISYYTIKGNDIETALIECAEKDHSDMIVLVHKEYDFFEGLLHHSITKKIIINHSMPTLIYHLKQEVN